MRNKITKKAQKERLRKWYSGFLPVVILSFFFMGCECYKCPLDHTPPAPPQGIYSITGDRQVTLEWLPNQEEDLAGYRVYRSFKPYGYYEWIGTTYDNFYIDTDVENGVTYFYAVSAFDVNGNESDLSYDVIYDTPRPEGYGVSLWDADLYPTRSGWDFSRYTVVPYDDSGADFYFVGEDGIYYIVATEGTDIQDLGWTETMDDVDYAPSGGWSQAGYAEAIKCHCYVFWTRDNHFAKIRISTLDGERMVFDWAYQVDPGNGELVEKRGENDVSR